MADDEDQLTSLLGLVDAGLKSARNDAEGEKVKPKAPPVPSRAAPSVPTTKPRPVSDPIAAPDEGEIPTNTGMVPADQPVNLNFKVSAGLRYHFRLLLRKQGLDIQTVLSEYMERCVELGYVPDRGEDD